MREWTDWAGWSGSVQETALAEENKRDKCASRNHQNRSALLATYLADLGSGWLAGDDQRGGAGGGCWLGLVRRWMGYGEVLNRDTVRGNVVDLAGCGHVDQVIGLNLNFVTGWQEGVEAHDEIRMTFEELRDSANHTWCINAEDTKREH